MVSKRFGKVVSVFRTSRTQCSLFLGLGYLSSVIEDIVQDVLQLIVDRNSPDFQEPMPLRVLPKKHS